MEKISIEGVNGYIEVNSRYVYVNLNNRNVNNKKGHSILFEEITEVTYKKPTKEKYGHITIYVSENTSKGKKETSYRLVLDKINQKEIEKGEKVFSIIDGLISSNKNIRVEEEETDENEILEIIKEVKVYTEEIDYNPLVEYGIDNKKEEKKDEEKEGKKPSPKQEIFVNPGIKKKEEEKKEPEEKKELINNEVKYTDEEKKETPKEKTIEKEIEEPKPEIIGYYIPFMGEEERENNLTTIESLEKELKDIEKEVVKLLYKETLLNKYTDEAKEKEEIDKLIDEINDLIKKLDKIKKEILLQEKEINKQDLIYLNNGKVVVTEISKRLVNRDSKKIDSYVDIYKDTIKEIENLESKLDDLTKNADDKKDEIELSDEQYEKDINMMRKLESTKDLIEQYRKEAYDDINRIKREIETTVDDKTRFRLVRRGISNQTRLLAGLLALNSLRPRRSRLASFALTTAVGIAAIGDMLSFDTVEEHYKEITRTETLLGVDNVDTEKARSLITESKGQIERILEDCEKKYKDYPQFDELKQELLSIQEEIDKEDKLLLETEKELENYRKEERVKILKKIE